MGDQLALVGTLAVELGAVDVREKLAPLEVIDDLVGVHFRLRRDDEHRIASLAQRAEASYNAGIDAVLEHAKPGEAFAINADGPQVQLWIARAEKLPEGVASGWTDEANQRFVRRNLEPHFRQ